MAEVIINCPQCQRPLRVTDELRNRLVKCPTCDVTFRMPGDSNEPQPVTPLRPEVASVSPGGPRPPTVGPEGYDPGFRREQPEPWDLALAERERARTAVQLPAILLLITGLLGLLVNLWHLSQWIVQPEAMLQMVRQFMGPLPDPQALIGVSIGVFAVLATASLVVIFGAIQMLRLRMYGLTLVGSLLPMINCNTGCCVLGIPLGIWALVVLLRPEVRAAFKSR